MLRVACGVHAMSVRSIDLHTSYVRVFPSTCGAAYCMAIKDLPPFLAPRFAEIHPRNCQHSACLQSSDVYGL